MILFINNRLFLGKQDFYTTSKGAYIVIHNRTTLPSVKYEGLVVQAGTASNIAISRTYYSKLDSPFSDCRKDTSTVLSTDTYIFEQTINVTKYSQKLCYELCLQNLFIIPKCGCADASIPIVDDNQAICKNSTSLACVSSERDKFDNIPIGELCDTHCPLECDSVEYSTSVSSSDYPTSYYSDILRQQSNFTSKFSPANSFPPSNLYKSDEIKKKYCN